MILHDETFNELAQIHCKVISGNINVFEQIQLFCNSKDSNEYLKAKAKEKIQQENGKIPFVSVLEFSIIKRLPMDLPVTMEMANIDSHQVNP